MDRVDGSCRDHMVHAYEVCEIKSLMEFEATLKDRYMSCRILRTEA